MPTMLGLNTTLDAAARDEPMASLEQRLAQIQRTRVRASPSEARIEDLAARAGKLRALLGDYGQRGRALNPVRVEYATTVLTLAEALATSRTSGTRRDRNLSAAARALGLTTERVRQIIAWLDDPAINTAAS